MGGVPLAFGVGDTKKRIQNVLCYKKPALWVIAVSAVAVIALSIGLISNPKDSGKTGFGSSAKDLANRYTLALAASDITGMRRFTPALNPPAQEMLDIWRQIQIENAAILQEDIRESKAVFEIWSSPITAFSKSVMRF